MSCMGMTHRTPCRQSTVWGSSMVLYAILLLSRSSLQHRMMGRPYETQDFYFLGERCRKIIITWKVHHWLHNCRRIKENFLKKKKSIQSPLKFALWIEITFESLDSGHRVTSCWGQIKIVIKMHIYLYNSSRNGFILTFFFPDTKLQLVN